MSTVAVLDYGSGNLHSVAKALEAAARDSTHARVLVTDDPAKVRGADRIVLPGVGAFADCKAGLVAVPGLLDALTEAVIDQGRPFLGICVGQQLMAREGLEHGGASGLGWLDGRVSRLAPDDASLKIPHMGWNTLQTVRPHPILDGIETGETGAHVYFVHSFHMTLDTPDALIATTPYGGPVTSLVGRDNLVGTQFHPEKSQGVGQAILANFLRWNP